MNYRYGHGARDKGSDKSPSGEIGQSNLSSFRRCCPVTHEVVWTAVQAVHAQNALTDSYFFARLAGSLTISVTEMAATAFGATLSYSYSPKRKCSQNAKKGSQGANEPAVEAGNREVQ